MQHTYTLRAADGQEYGPVSLDQLTGWAREGRVTGQSELRRSDMQHWSPAEAFTELQSLFQRATATAAAPAAASVATAFPAAASAGVEAANAALVAQLRSGSSWFYWIAGLSLINSIVAVTGSDWRFILGLGITQVFDAFAAAAGTGAAKTIAFALDLFVAGLLVVFGVFGGKGHLWAFIVGMVLFALDGLIFLIAADWLGVGFHAFVLFCLFRGLQACWALRKTS